MTPTPPKKAPVPLNNDDDDGSTCSICLDTWESKGAHHLVALKCGHLFGESCIKRYHEHSSENLFSQLITSFCII